VTKKITEFERRYLLKTHKSTDNNIYHDYFLDGKKVLDECDKHKDSLKINLERTTTQCFVNKRKVTPIAYGKQNFCTRPIKSFLFFQYRLKK